MIPGSAFGLIFDIVGVIFLGVAFFSQDIRGIASLVTTRWDFHSDLARHHATTTFDGKTGTVFLAVGFVFQSIYIFWKFDVLLCGLAWLLLSVFALLCRRGGTAKRWAEEAAAIANETAGTEAESDQTRDEGKVY